MRFPDSRIVSSPSLFVNDSLYRISQGEEAGKGHTQNAKPGLLHWYRTMKSANVCSFVELRALFPGADQVGTLTVVNTGGNTARPIA
ncbi:type II toxin-antitoxin system HigB family toxin [Roseiflexus sp.]|uniref:type II toxin-antitoxin system HigB family toxin n=1 Tax=Roseiflexus sp. TaxID=2562120 RepID=UPI002584BED0|nr:type II toxin-antitoxin system HigB family toxin [Roseiflexus sp.]